MVRIRILLADGMLSSLHMSGHARAGKDGDPAVCAALSALARSAASTLRLIDGVIIQGEAPDRGELAFDVVYADDVVQDRIRGVSDMMLNGMMSIATENPRFCAVEVAHVDL